MAESNALGMYPVMLTLCADRRGARQSVAAVFVNTLLCVAVSVVTGASLMVVVNGLRLLKASAQSG